MKCLKVFLVLGLLSCFLVGCGEEEQGKKRKQEKQKRQGTAAKTYTMRGITHYITGDYDGAIQDYTKAIKLDPSCREALEPWIKKARGKLKSEDR